MEHDYSEIPLPPAMELQHKPFQIEDLMRLDYQSKQQAGNCIYNKGPSMGHPSVSSSSGLHNKNYISSGSQRDTFSTELSTQGMQLNSEAKDKGKMDDLDLDIYTRMRSPVFVCTRQVTIHVIIMILCGIVYLGIGGIAGFYIGKLCKYD